MDAASPPPPPLPGGQRQQYTFSPGPAPAPALGGAPDEMYSFFAWPPDSPKRAVKCWGPESSRQPVVEKPAPREVAAAPAAGAGEPVPSDETLSPAEADFVSQLLPRLVRVTERRLTLAERRGTDYRPEFPLWYKGRFDALNAAARCVNLLRQKSIEKEESDLVPYVFTWTSGGHVVELTGSFLNWDVPVKMVRSGHEFSVIRELPRQVHTFKFIVDGHWRCAPHYRTETDSNGHLNNVIDLTDFRSQIFVPPVDHEMAAREDAYNQVVPGSADFITDAPIIPVLLSKSCSAVDTQVMRSLAPLQALSNHLYHDSYAAHIFGPSVSAVTSIQRWRYTPRNPTQLSMAGLRFSTLTYVTFNPLFPFHGDPAFEIPAAGPLRCLLQAPPPRKAGHRKCGAAADGEAALAPPPRSIRPHSVVFAEMQE